MAKVYLFRFTVVYLLVCVPIIFCAPKGKPKNAQFFEGECNFDSKKFCNWHQDNSDKFDWTLQKGSTRSGGTGPRGDYSGKGRGYYAYIETSSPRREGDNARLKGGPFSGVHCLQFAYSMVGNSIGKLNILHVLHGLEQDVWSRKGEQRGSEWKTGNVTVYGNNFYVIFEAFAGRSYTGDIALDDIYLVKGPCKGESSLFQNETESESSGKCNFDMGLCDWANDLVGADKSPWRLSSSRGRGRSVAARPDRGGRLGGKFVYAMQSSQRATQSRLISAKVCGLKCVEVFYFMENFKKSEFRLSTRKNGIEDRVWFTTGAGTETEDWTRALVEINVDDRTCYQLVFEANLNGELKSIVGMDDIFIANGSCCPMINTPEETAKANCDFDEGTFCKWKPSPKSTFSWSLGSGETRSGIESGGVTGPTSDASGKGKYAYIEASEPQIQGDKAVLVSDLLVGQQCMQFKYNMHGEDVGALSIYRRGNLVWREIGNLGNKWLKGQVDFDCSIHEYHVEIEATVLGWRGDIAIDELKFTSGLCPVNSLGAAAALRPTKPVPVILPPLLPPYSVCTFEHNLCGWTNSFNDDGEWKIHFEDTPSFHTGPQYDSDGNGFYIYMEASGLRKGQEIRLESKEFFTPICLHFHYHMYGKDANELRLEQRNLTDNSTKVVWSVKGEQEDYWHSGLQDFYGEHYMVTFVAVRGESYLGDIALDEIAVNEVDECKVLKETKYSAKDVARNPKEGNCDFEDTTTQFCKWINAKGDRFDWTRHSGKTPSGGTGPSFDHTKGEKQKNGKYIYIETSSPRRKGETALLLVKLEGRAFCMRFWYHMYGDYGIGSLKIVRIVKKLTDDHKPDTKDFTVKTIEWEISKSRGNKWLYKELDLEVDRSVRRHAIHWIGILGTVGSTYRGDIAVDDIEFEDGRCSYSRPKN